MFPYSAVSASVVSSSSPAAPSSVQVTVQSVSVPARRSRRALHSYSTAMKVATTSERLRLPLNRARNRVTPKRLSRSRISLALSATG